MESAVTCAWTDAQSSSYISAVTAAAKTLPDFLRPGLRVMSIGINPSLHAARAGFPFAFRRNRFWPALNQSQLISETMVPGVEATNRLLGRHGIGFTDVVKRATPGMRNLKAADYAAGALELEKKIEFARPAWLWFHGKTAIRGFKRYYDNSRDPVEWGEQDRLLCGVRCYVSPNPSPANASFSLQDIVASYDGLAIQLKTASP